MEARAAKHEFTDCAEMRTYRQKLEEHGFIFERYLRDGGALYAHPALELRVKIYLRKNNKTDRYEEDNNRRSGT